MVHTARITVILVLLMSVTARSLALDLNLNLPEIGDPSGAVVSPQEERTLGGAFYRSLQQKRKVINDPEINEYIGYLGNRLASNSDQPAIDFSFFVLDDPSINAFAAPGGYIGIHSGLMLADKSEGELAAVIAHEIAHVTQRHMARTFETARNMAIPYAITILTAILLGTQDPNLGQAALFGGLATQAQREVNFTRQTEFEADRVGIALLARAGYDPRNMAVTFQRLQESGRFYGEGPPEYLRTHPVYATRISEALSRAESLPATADPDDTDFHLVRAKLQTAQAADAARLVHDYRRQIDTGQTANINAARYGLALALTAAGKPDEAREVLRDLIERDGDRVMYHTALARAELEANRIASALAVYREALSLYPQNYPLTIAYSEALLRADRPDDARHELRRQARNRPEDPLVYQLLSVAAERAGQRGEAHAAHAEFHYYSGNLDAAIDQMKRALQAAGDDSILIAQANARLRELEKERSETEDEKGRHSN
jgi:predicted Zn-dependent protease